MDQQVTNYTPMTIGDWIITFIITYIPFVGLIMLFVWAFGDGAHPSKKTWAQALLIIVAISIILTIIFIIVFFSLLASFLDGLSSGYSSYS
jgi:hypothetical protein